MKSEENVGVNVGVHVGVNVGVNVNEPEMKKQMENNKSRQGRKKKTGGNKVLQGAMFPSVRCGDG